jgi:hypothetical protein
MDLLAEESKTSCESAGEGNKAGTGRYVFKPKKVTRRILKIESISFLVTMEKCGRYCAD